MAADQGQRLSLLLTACEYLWMRLCCGCGKENICVDVSVRQSAAVITDRSAVFSWSGWIFTGTSGKNWL